jgi:hypothetical protein
MYFGMLLRRTLFVLAPVIFLFVDLISFPRLLNNKPILTNVRAVSLLAHGQTELGLFQAHEIYVSVDDIAAAGYLSLIKKGPTALVVSGFVDDNGEVEIAALGDAVLKKLQVVSPADYHRALDLLQHSKHQRPGDILNIQLQIPAKAHSIFPIDDLYIALFTAGSPVDPDELSKGITSAIVEAQARGVQNLVLPCLGRNWEHSGDSNSLSFGDFFSSAFQSITTDSSTPSIHFSLYKEWPSFEIEDAVGSLNASWRAVAFPKQPPSEGLFYRANLRLTVIFWFVCLLVSSFYTLPTLKHFAIISVGYLGMAVGSDKLIDFMTQGRPQLGVYIRVATLLILAVGFPVIVSWNPKDLFGASGQHR